METDTCPFGPENWAIITSIGANATQTVRHTHLHVVPRRPGDGLALPWTHECGDNLDTALSGPYFCDKPLGHRGEHRAGGVTWWERKGTV